MHVPSREQRNPAPAARSSVVPRLKHGTDCSNASLLRFQVVSVLMHPRLLSATTTLSATFFVPSIFLPASGLKVLTMSVKVRSREYWRYDEHGAGLGSG